MISGVRQDPASTRITIFAELPPLTAFVGVEDAEAEVEAEAESEAEAETAAARLDIRAGLPAIKLAELIPSEGGTGTGRRPAVRVAEEREREEEEEVERTKKKMESFSMGPFPRFSALKYPSFPLFSPTARSARVASASAARAGALDAEEDDDDDEEEALVVKRIALDASAAALCSARESGGCSV